MRFEVTQHYDAAAEDVLAFYSSQAFFEGLPDFGRISAPELVDHRAHGDEVVVRARYAFTAELPAAALAVIDPERLTWVEQTTYDLRQRRASVTFHPDHYASKLRAQAQVTFDGDATSSTRIIRGDLRVRVLLVGSQVERVIVDGLREHLREEATHVAGRVGR